MWNLDLKNDMNVKEEMVRDEGKEGVMRVSMMESLL
jgi:hypothetical protein